MNCQMISTALSILAKTLPPSAMASNGLGLRLATNSSPSFLHPPARAQASQESRLVFYLRDSKVGFPPTWE